MSMLRTLISLAAAAMLINLATATSFTVGGLTGEWDTTTNLKAWASSQTFLVGDSLTFPTSPFHNVVEVSKADYDSCQNSNPIQLHSGGTTPVPLISPGSRYFICGATGHCSRGMKVEIVTLAASAASPAPLATPIPAADSPLTPLASPSPTGLPAFFPVPLEPTEMPTSKPLANLGPTSSSLPPSESSVSHTRNAFSPPELSSVAKVRVGGGSMLGVACFMMVLIVL